MQQYLTFKCCGPKLIAFAWNKFLLTDYLKPLDGQVWSCKFTTLAEYIQSLKWSIWLIIPIFTLGFWRYQNSHRFTSVGCLLANRISFFLEYCWNTGLETEAFSLIILIWYVHCICPVRLLQRIGQWQT